MSNHVMVTDITSYQLYTFLLCLEYICFDITSKALKNMCINFTYDVLWESY